MSGLDLGQFAAVEKSGLDAMFGILNKAFASIGELASLDLQAFRSTLAEHQEIAARALSTRHPQGVFSLQAGRAQPTVEKGAVVLAARVRNQVRHSGRIHRDPRSAVQTVPVRRASIGENFAKNAPPGSEAAVSAWESTIETDSVTFEASRKATGQAGQIVQSHVSAGPDAATRSTGLDVEQA